MLVKNKNLANQLLGVPGTKAGVRGDALGVFNVPDAFGEKLCATPGWEKHGGTQGPVAGAKPELQPERVIEGRVLAWVIKMMLDVPNYEECLAGFQERYAILVSDGYVPKAELKPRIENVSAVAQESQSLGSKSSLKVHVPNPAPVAVPDVPPPAPVAVTEPAPAAADETADGPDLDALDKDGLLKVAKEYDIEVSERWGEKRLRATLDAALYDGDGETDEDDDAPESAKGE